MGAIEIVLILIGVAFVIGSYFVQERFSEKDIQDIAKMSESQLSMVVEKQVKAARVEVENSVEEIIDESLAITKRGLERETNQKIMAISEYSDTVLEAMNKTHNEIMFLYRMLNDKQSEMTDMVGSLQKYSKGVAASGVNTPQVPDGKSALEYLAPEEPAAVQSEFLHTQLKLTEEQMSRVTEKTGTGQSSDGEPEEELVNKNEQILMLHKEGKNEVEIAKTLDCGLGEVRLVLGLFTEEGK